MQTLPFFSQRRILKVCYTCRLGSQTRLNYAEYVKNKHGLPKLDLEEDQIDLTRPTVSSISGGVKYYEFQPGEKNLDIMDNMFRKRDEVSRTIEHHTYKFPQKLQVNVEMMVQKPLEEEIEKVSVYFNTETVTVYHSGISYESYESLIDNIVSKLVIFSSYGSGWQLLSIDKVTMKLTRCVTVRGSTRIPFHEGHPLRSDSNLLNIHNGRDNNCFLY